MAKHDSWIHLSSDSPFERIRHLFPEGFPVVDPFPMDSGSLDDGTPVSLWKVDDDRLTFQQMKALTCLFAEELNISIKEVLKRHKEIGFFFIDHQWVEDVYGGLKALERTIELQDFLRNSSDDTPKASQEWLDFVADQKTRWY